MKKSFLTFLAMLLALTAGAATTKTLWSGEFYSDQYIKNSWRTWKNVLDLDKTLFYDIQPGDRLVLNADSRDGSQQTRLQLIYVDASDNWNWVIITKDGSEESVPVVNGKYSMTVTGGNIDQIKSGLMLKGENLILRSVQLVSDRAVNDDNHIAQGSFHTSGTKLLDANNNEFVMRGCNYSWTWQRGNETSVIPAAKRIGCNAIRIQLGDGDRYYKPSKQEFEALIRLCEKNKLIAVFNTHDETGSNDYSDLERAARFWIEMKDILNAHLSTVIVNISNEWYGAWNEADQWADGYKKVIPMMRDAGILNTLVVDAAGYGQWPQSIFSRGRDVAASDKLGNIMFAIHFYDEAGKSESSVKGNIDRALSLNIPLLIGEFAYKHKGKDIAYQAIMDYCQEKSVGYLVWSWTGNSGGTEDCDMFAGYDESQYRPNGTATVLGRNGIKETSRECSVFDPDAEEGDDPQPPVDPDDPDDPTPDDRYTVVDTYTPSSPLVMNSAWDQIIVIPASAFTAINEKSVVRLHFSKYDGAQIQIAYQHAEHWAWTKYSDVEYPYQPTFDVSVDSFEEAPDTADAIAGLKAHGMSLKGQDFAISKVEILAPKASAIEEITDGTQAAIDWNLPVEIYTLTGVRVNEMLPGSIYIVRQGSTVMKLVK